VEVPPNNLCFNNIIDVGEKSFVGAVQYLSVGQIDVWMGYTASLFLSFGSQPHAERQESKKESTLHCYNTYNILVLRLRNQSWIKKLLERTTP
jgi:hypothetical protein